MRPNYDKSGDRLSPSAALPRQLALHFQALGASANWRLYSPGLGNERDLDSLKRSGYGGRIGYQVSFLYTS